MRIIFLGDTHFGARSDSLVFHNHFDKFYTGVLFPYMEKENITHIIQLGDLFDRRKYINFNTLHLAREYFFEPLRQKGFTMDVFVGNHDTYYRSGNEVNSPNLLLGEYTNIRTFSEPVTCTYDDIDIALLPWVNTTNHDECMEFLDETKAPILLGHLEIAGFEMYKGSVVDHGMPMEPFMKFDTVCSGHFHHKSSRGNIHYLGCIHRTGKVTTEDGIQTIKQIVDSKYKGKVLSFNEKTHNLEWKSVINHSKGSIHQTNKKWVALKTNTKCSEVRCTDDHPVYVVDNILNPSLHIVEAVKTAGRYLVSLVTDKKDNKNFLYNEDQISVLIGSLLGDGTITKKGLFTEDHSPDQSEYLKFKATVLNAKPYALKKQGSWSWRFSERMHCRINDQTRLLRSMFYRDGKKVITEEVLNLLNPLALAVWYCDDGNLLKQKKSREEVYGFSLNTQSFTYDEHLLIKDWFSKNLDIDLTIVGYTTHYKGVVSKKYYLSCYKWSHVSKFFNTIAPFVPKVIESYTLNKRDGTSKVVNKIPPCFQGGSKVEINSTFLNFSTQYVNEVVPLPPKLESLLYDIEVEDNHNFFVNGKLVHNCPYQLTWSDYGDPKGFHVFDTTTRSLDFVLNPYQMFHKVHYNDLEKEMEEVVDGDFSMYEGSYVKVVVHQKTNPYWFDMFITNLEKAGAADIQIVEDHLNLNMEDEADIMKEAEDTPTILKKVVEGLDTNISKKALESFLISLYQEAQFHEG